MPTRSSSLSLSRSYLFHALEAPLSTRKGIFIRIRKGSIRSRYSKYNTQQVPEESHVTAQDKRASELAELNRTEEEILKKLETLRAEKKRIFSLIALNTRKKTEKEREKPKEEEVKVEPERPFVPPPVEYRRAFTPTYRPPVFRPHRYEPYDDGRLERPEVRPSMSQRGRYERGGYRGGFTPRPRGYSRPPPRDYYSGRH